MNHRPITSPRAVHWACLAVCAQAGVAQTLIARLDPAEPLGTRPYEMVWANRTEPAPPSLRFDQLEGWTLQAEAGAEASLELSRAQNLWDRPVAKLRYRGAGQANAQPRIVLTPPQPIGLPADADSVELWAYGNRWDWENPPDTPPVGLVLRFQAASGPLHELPLDRVRWKEWWLVHKRLPAGWPAPLRFTGLEIGGGWQTDWREIYFDSVRFYREELAPLDFAPRPQRNLTLFEGQSPGANTGPGTLPFPTRAETILPMHFGGPYTNWVAALNSSFAFHYRGEDGEVTYGFSPRQGLAGLSASCNGVTVGRPLDGAQIRLADGAVGPTGEPEALDLAGGVLRVRYPGGTLLQLRIWQKSLVLDVINTTGQATDLNFGQVLAVVEPRAIFVPYLTYGGGAQPAVLLSRAGTNRVFTSLWLDWYRSNGSEPYAAEGTATNAARINGGVRYHPRTDGRRNPLFERLFLTVSPRFEEVLPTVPNPVGLHAHQAVDRLWQESWGPDDYEKQMRRSRMLRAYGLEMLIQCNHEIAWRDGGESFTLRTRAAPNKGGDAALAEYVAHQRGLGWFAGLYSNYTDYAPVNEFWTPDGVQRAADGNWRTAWPRCYALKPLKAVEFDARLAPQIQAQYKPNSAYTDVHTAVAPWSYIDYDARVPGAGTFAQTFYAYGEILRHDSQVYGGPIFSEGTYHWLYAGLADGNYALAYNRRPLAHEPLLPVFDLYQIHTRECDIGMGWTANFCDALPDWRKPENLDRAIDRFLLHTLAYGHIGWLVEEAHGIERTCRSYYMLQQVQARYGLKPPTRIAYWDGTNLVSVSEALVQDLPRNRRQLFVEYPGGLQLWLNDHPTENWQPPVVQAGLRLADGGLQIPEWSLPPAGWAAFTTDGELVSYSGLNGAQRVDYLRSPAYTYLDGRGQPFATAEAAAESGLVIRPLAPDQLEAIRTSGRGPFTIRRPYDVRGACVAVEAYGVDGKALSTPVMQDTGETTRLEPVEAAVRYVLRFGSASAPLLKP
ncbi:MAG: hypothetical protein FJ387_05550 [Verrucomicrobia bacterium]|nr:hypothetical protein [Verrucomicrobiota bacterium]